MIELENGVAADPLVALGKRLFSWKAIEDLGVGELGKLGREDVHQCASQDMKMVIAKRKYTRAARLLDRSHSLVGYRQK